MSTSPRPWGEAVRVPLGWTGPLTPNTEGRLLRIVSSLLKAPTTPWRGHPLNLPVAAILRAILVKLILVVRVALVLIASLFTQRALVPSIRSCPTVRSSFLGDGPVVPMLLLFMTTLTKLLGKRRPRSLPTWNWHPAETTLTWVLELPSVASMDPALRKSIAPIATRALVLPWHLVPNFVSRLVLAMLARTEKELLRAPLTACPTLLLAILAHLRWASMPRK